MTIRVVEFRDFTIPDGKGQFHRHLRDESHDEEGRRVHRTVSVDGCPTCSTEELTCPS